MPAQPARETLAHHLLHKTWDYMHGLNFERAAAMHFDLGPRLALGDLEISLAQLKNLDLVDPGQPPQINDETMTDDDHFYVAFPKEDTTPFIIRTRNGVITGTTSLPGLFAHVELIPSMIRAITAGLVTKRTPPFHLFKAENPREHEFLTLLNNVRYARKTLGGSMLRIAADDTVAKIREMYWTDLIFQHPEALIGAIFKVAGQKPITDPIERKFVTDYGKGPEITPEAIYFTEIHKNDPRLHEVTQVMTAFNKTQIEVEKEPAPEME